MKYEQIVKATFLERENRFVARVRIDGRETGVHVKNTGRCRELLVPGATVYLEDHHERMGTRKYRYDLVAVEKGSTLINMDSQAPNKVVAEALNDGSLLLPNCDVTERMHVYPEKQFGSSRFDFFVEGYKPSNHTPRRMFIEVKGVTLEENGVARFPDAPTLRGIKHIQELEQALAEGFGSYILFLIQMKGTKHFEPNDDTHPGFGEALRHAKATGVNVLAYDCIVRPDSLILDRSVPVRL